MKQLADSSGLSHGGVCGCAACSLGMDQFNGGVKAYVAPVAGGAGDGTNGLGTVTSQLIWGTEFDWREGTSPAITVTYSYAYANWAFADNGSVSAPELLNAAQKASTEQAIAMWESVANINLVEANNGSATHMVFRQGNHNFGAAGQAYWNWNQAGTNNKHVDVMYAKGYAANPTLGTDAFTMILHEIGHALGLNHAGNYNGGGAVGGNTFYDNQDVSLMSYFPGVHAVGANRPSSPMLYDIAAIQAIYGANTAFNAGNTTYTIDGSNRSWAIWDGGGVDTLSAGAAATGVKLDLREGQLNVNEVGASNVWIAFNARIENALGGSGNDSIFGNTLANGITGGVGNDTIAGGGGADVLVGGAGNDTVRLVNGDGADRIQDSDAGDVLVINNATIAGTATVQAANSYRLTVGGVNYTLTLAGTVLTVAYNNGADSFQIENFASGDFGIVLGAGGGGNPPPPPPPAPPAPPAAGGATPGADLLRGSDADNSIDGLAGNDTIHGLGGNDTLIGGDGNDMIYGGLGNDVERAGAGDDLVNGGEGDDSIEGESGNDSMNGGNGNDTIRGGDGNDTLIGSNGINHLDGGAGDDKIHGGIDADLLIGGDGNDYLSGSTGNNTMEGGAGNDLMVAGANNDVMNGGADTDTLHAYAGNDTLYGGLGNDQLFAGDGNDQVNGDGGNDTLTGGTGSDVFSGGDGADIFRFSGASGVDVVTDFLLGVDKLDVTGALSTILSKVVYDADSALVTLSTGNTVDLLGITGGLTLGDLM